ncbi:MAG: IS66 family insertion sequence element accessory protein TnpB [Oscillospiraceae bacterium]|jgi:transposase|nr:IS66 family insertion sequence element accessory protein TnpB [Oscillospiraceae bacterium]
MLNFSGKQIYLACGATSMQSGIDALASVVQSSFRLTPTSDAIFVFCNANRDRIKILEWDGDGFWLHYKRLERGRFPWPAKSGEEKTMTLSQCELEYLLGGSKLKQRFDRIDFSGRLAA